MSYYWRSRRISHRIIEKIANSSAYEQYLNHVSLFADWVQASTNSSRTVDLCFVHDSLALEAGRRLRSERHCGLVFDGVEYPDYSGRPSDLGRTFARDPESLSRALSFERAILDEAEALLVGTPHVQACYQEHTNAPKAAVVRNCIDYLPRPDSDRIRRLCGLDADAKLLLFPNSAYRKSGFDICMSAMKLLDPSVHLAVLGQIPRDAKAGARAVLRTSGLNARIHFLEPRPPEELLTFRSGADLSLIVLDPAVPSYYTALPNRAFESIMSRTPLVTTDLPNVRALVEEYDCGTISKDQSATSVAEAINRALDNLGHYRERTEVAAGTLNWERERPRFLRALEPVLGDRGGARVIYLANKSLETNTRTFRHVRTLKEIGCDVEVLSVRPPANALTVDGVTYKAMQRA